MHIGFIGLGRMGQAMAGNLAAAGHQVTAWNRSPVPADNLHGVEIVRDPAAAMAVDVVFSMLADDSALRTVLIEGKLLDRASPGLVHVNAATISVALAEELTALHAQKGVSYVAAPVFGRPDVAAAAKLNIVAAGPAADLDRVQPLLAVLGQRVFVMGDRPAQANAAKIAGNMMLAMAIEAMAEAVTLTAGHGIDRQPFLDLMLSTLFSGRAYESYAPKIIAGDYTAGFRLALGLKDLRLATEAGAAAGRPLPMLDAVRRQMQAAADAGLGDQDWSAVADYTQKG